MDGTIKKKGYIEKKWDFVDNYLVGKAIGALVSKLLRPQCKQQYKMTLSKVNKILT